MSERELYRIKPLVWEDKTSRYESLRHEAKSMVGTLVARKLAGGDYIACCLSDLTGLDNWDHMSLESAKAECESWYRTKLLEALELYHER